MKNYWKFRKSILWAVLIPCLILFPSPAFAQYFTITKFHSDIIIHKNSSFTVHETIEVKFHRSMHGIYREVPFKYKNEFGKTITTPITILSVKDEAGKSLKYQVKKTGGLINIRIGDPKQFVSGSQTYVIAYEVENAILFLDDHDELYWNVTGNYWRADIGTASADVSLATEEKSKDLWAKGFTGPYGSKASDCRVETGENGAKFATTESLRQGEGLTIVLGWDKGLISPPSSLKKFFWLIDPGENWILPLPFLSLITMFCLWYSRGRDPRVREAVTVMYEPPKFEEKPLLPAEVGALIDERLDSRDITSTILGLAVKGYIKIEERKKEGLLFDSIDYYLQKVKASDAKLTLFEMELIKSLFPRGLSGTPVSDLKNKFYVNLPSLRKTLYGELVRKGYFYSSPERVRNTYLAVGTLITLFAILTFLFLLSHSPGKGFLVGVCTGLPFFVFSRFMPAKTKAGASAYMETLGFQEFMDRAEKDRLERMGDMGLFSKFLPYAIALDVADNWAKAFEGIYQTPPDWYISPVEIRTFNPTVFTRSINSMTSSLSTAMFSAPRGSSGRRGGGLGGGGFSGGGFGGGGGGSW